MWENMFSLAADYADKEMFGKQGLTHISPNSKEYYQWLHYFDTAMEFMNNELWKEFRCNRK